MSRVKYLVVDSNAFINTVPLQDYSDKIVTVKDVVSEIRDSATRSRLQVLPYELIFREPSQSSIKHITEFSKKTGDYTSLSATDIRLIALTYQLECEEGIENGRYLHTDPYSRIDTTSNRGVQSESADTELVKIKDLHIDDDTLKNDETKCNKGSHSDVIDDDDDEGWITPDNLHEVCKSFGGSNEVPLSDGIAVGCMTSDYAMQNVILQMGLHLISTDGLLIKRLQTYAMQCKACFKTSFNMGTYFCGHCGNRAMIKVTATVCSDGTIEYTPLSSKQFSCRGLRYSQPLPKGGRQPNKPLLSPDQRVTFRLPRSRENKMDPLHPDYIINTSPFCTNDVHSRGVQIAFRHGGIKQIGSASWHRNPNEARKKKK